MSPRTKNIFPFKAFLIFTLAFCAVFLALIAYIAIFHGENNVHAFAEPVYTLSDGWIITDSAGASRPIRFPETIENGADGEYTLSCSLPTSSVLLLSPALRIYSNYVDLSVSLDGRALYDYPAKQGAFSGATGNTYHFIRLPADYAGKSLRIMVRGQLGKEITYLLTAPLLGSKATMLTQSVRESLPAMMLASCMFVLSIGLGVLYLTLRRQFKMTDATLNTALFALLFALYIYCETIFAQLLTPNGYLLCFCTLTLLAFMPIPLMGIFADAVSQKFRHVSFYLMLLCCINLMVQMTLNFAGLLSVREMLPATHAVILLSIITMAICLFFSDRAERPLARKTLLSAVPMIAGGMTDIILLNLEKPSFNNSFYFTLGVTAFIVIQFFSFVRRYFSLYRQSFESKLLRDMAYCDTLTGIGNRNAYENKLKDLSGEPLTEHLCCIVLDINDLKQINDMHGHPAGDAAIVDVGTLLCQRMPSCASCFRTGGDEFIVLLNGYEEADAKTLAEQIALEAEQRGKLRAIPISLAFGCGHYEPFDSNIIDFIRRVDADMYACKRRQKESPSYPFASSC